MSLKNKVAIVTGGNSGIDTSEEQYEKVLRINLNSAFFGTQLEQQAYGIWPQLVKTVGVGKQERR